MDSLLDKIRGSNYNENENLKVMGRLQWLNHLCLIFNLTSGSASILPSPCSITTEAFLNTLIENFQNLPLVPLSQYNSPVKSLSFKDIFSCFESDFGRLITWDYVLEKLVNLEKIEQSKNKRERSESPGSIDLNELVYISKLSSSSVDYDNEHRCQRLGDLRIPQTPPGLESYSFQALSENFTPSPRGSQDYGNLNAFSNRLPLRVPELGDHLRNFMLSKSSEERIRANLSCKKISILTSPLPSSLIELNLSHNRIARFPNLEGLERLEYLSLSWNVLISLSGIKRLCNLREIYMAHNRISELDHISQCENLVIVDASYNKILYFQAIAELQNTKLLKVLSVEGNGIIKQLGFKDSMNSMLPHVSSINPKNISTFSKFPSQQANKKGYTLKKSESLKIKSRK